MNSLENQNHQENQEVQKLEKDFIDTLSEYSNDVEKIEVIFKKLTTLYSSEGRYYHTLKHIQAMLSFLKEQKDAIKNPKALFLATWYHDAIYDSRSKTNEVDSAEMMKEDLLALGAPIELIQVIYQFIVATQKHQTLPSDTDCDIFLDSDLSILGRPEHVYAGYTTNIRKEYAWVLEDDYKKGRGAVLENFLKRDRIYFSSGMEQAEAAARKNIEQELSQLVQ